MSEDQRKDPKSGARAGDEGDKTSSGGAESGSKAPDSGAGSRASGAGGSTGAKSGRSRTSRGKRGGAKATASASASKPTSGKSAASKSAASKTPPDTRSSDSQRTPDPARASNERGSAGSGLNAPATKPAAAAGAAATPPTRSATAGGSSGSGPERGPLIIAVVALVIAIIALIIAGWLLQRGQQRVSSLAERVQTVEDGMQSNVQKVVMPRLSQFDSRLQALSGDIKGNADDVSSLGDKLSSLQDDLDASRARTAALVERIDSAGNQWQLQRIESLLQAANQRVQLYDDPQGGQQALKLANGVIGRMGDPKLFDVRKAVVDEIAALQALPHPDIEGLSLTLASMAEQVPHLPLASDVPSQYESDNGQSPKQAASGVDFSQGWQHFVDSVRDALSHMLTIRESDGTQRALLPPDQAFFLGQNLQLQLRTARLALLEGDTQSYSDSLASAQQWLKDYYDTDKSAVSGMLEQLGQISNVKLDWQAPDISESLARLRKLMGNRGQAPSDDSGAGNGASRSGGSAGNQDSGSSGAGGGGPASGASAPRNSGGDGSDNGAADSEGSDGGASGNGPSDSGAASAGSSS